MRLTCACLLLMLVPTAGQAQASRAAVVVQVAGANLYVNVGSEAGLRAGDTVAVRRRPDGPLVGSLLVVGASSQRAVLGFASTAFPVTRGDTLFITLRAVVGEPVQSPSMVGAGAPQPQASRPAPPARVDGTLGLEMWGSHSQTVGVGANPVRTTRDIGVPALRFSTDYRNDNSHLRVNLLAQHRTGPTSVWDRQTRVRVYEARYDRTVGQAQVTVGRFYSDFDHQSAFWDGASVRLTATRGVSVGVAAGFEPARGNEELSFTDSKLAGFVSTRRSSERMDFVADLAVTQTFPKDGSLRRIGSDLSLRLRLNRLSISQDLEVAPPIRGSAWDLSRFVLRISMPTGQRGYTYASAVSDHFTPLDTAILLPFSRRERVTAGYSRTLRRGGYVDVNATVNDPRDSLRGYAVGSTVALPGIVEALTPSLHTSWFDDGHGSGILVSPAVDYRWGATRVRGGYQYYRINHTAFSEQTHGVNLRLWKPFGDRSSGVLQLSQRFGHNQSSTTMLTSYEWRF